MRRQRNVERWQRLELMRMQRRGVAQRREGEEKRCIGKAAKGEAGALMRHESIRDGVDASGTALRRLS